MLSTAAPGYKPSATQAVDSHLNPFALVTAAHLLTQQTRNDAETRFAVKWRLARLLYEREWDKQRILDATTLDEVFEDSPAH